MAVGMNRSRSRLWKRAHRRTTTQQRSILERSRAVAAPTKDKPRSRSSKAPTTKRARLLRIRSSRSAVERDDRLWRLHARCALHRSDGGAEGEKLDRVAPPHMRLLDELHFDDARGVETVRFVLHSSHR